MKDRIVAKFGGTSMGDSKAMLQSAKIVLENPQIRLVVVSAIAGTTNTLLDIHRTVLDKGVDEAKRLHSLLEERHLRIASELGFAIQENDPLRSLFQESENLIGQLKAHARGPDGHRLLDEFLSLGERLSSWLFTCVLKKSGVSSKNFDVRKVLRTDDHFGKAEPQIEEIRRLCLEYLEPLVDSDFVIVTQGFIGADSLGQTTTLGRGGSDYSAALLAQGLHANQVQIWTDVPGIYTMDPKIVSQAQKIDDISFAEATELANFGAKVLHPATLWPAIRKKIAVFVGSTFCPEAGGTRIHPELPAEFLKKSLIRAIALRKKQTLITVSSLRMLNAHGFLARIFEILARHRLSVDLVTTSEVSVALTIDGTSLGNSVILDKKEMLEELRSFCEVSIEHDLTLVALIGNQLNHTPGIGAQAFSAISQYNIRLICHGASSYNICFLVKADDADSVVQKLHKQFII